MPRLIITLAAAALLGGCSPVGTLAWNAGSSLINSTVIDKPLLEDDDHGEQN